MNLRRPTFGEIRLALVVGVPVSIMSVFVLRGCTTASVPLVHPPENAAISSAPPTTATADLTGVQLAGVEGTTTVVPIRSTGTAHLSGTVNGPQGPVPGAVVRAEHLVEGDPPPIDVAADGAGHWDLPNIAGGRYRVRAFLVPSFAQTQPEVFFLNDGEDHPLDLTVESFSGVSVVAAVAPDPPELNQPLTLAVRVAIKTVDTDGIVRSQPIVNASVTFPGGQGWSVEGSYAAATDANGDAVLGLVCRSAGASQVQVVVRATASDAPQALTLPVSECVDPNAGGSGSSSSSSSSAPPSSSSSSSSSKSSSSTASAPPPN